MQRYFADFLTSVTLSDDKHVVSMSFGNKKEGDGGFENSFDVVLPMDGFMRLASFFESFDKHLKEAEGNAEKPSVDEKVEKPIKDSQSRRTPKKVKVVK